jgi:hypothetical protein
MGGRARATNGVVFAQTNEPNGSIVITSIAGVTQPAPGLPMIADNTTQGAVRRFFAPITMGNLGTDNTDIGIAMSVLNAAGAPVLNLAEIPHVMQDIVTIRSAAFSSRRGALTVRATSSLPGNPRSPGARLSLESVASLDPAAPAIAVLSDNTTRRGTFVVNTATPPQFIRVRSSLGGSQSMAVPGVATTDNVTVRSAVFNQARGTLTVAASAGRRPRGAPPAPAPTFEGQTGVNGVTGAPIFTPLTGTITRGRLVVSNVTVPPSRVRVTIGTGSVTVPVTVQVARRR